MKETDKKSLAVIHYDNCITNLANSILQHFGVDTEGRKTLPAADRLLKKDYKNVVVILLDALGVDVIRKNLSPDGFFNQHLASEYYSVYPPTTVAATTSMLSGKDPCEHGWLSWDCYFPQIDESVEMFTNKKMGTEEPAAEFNVPWTFLGYENILSKINRNGGKACISAPFMDPYPKSVDEVLLNVKKYCDEPGKKYVYAYWNEPDGTLHRKGCYGPEAKEMVAGLEQKIQALCEDLKDTLVFVTADHGHMNTTNVCLKDYPKITECLTRTPSFEPRVLDFFVKEEKKIQFISEFEKEFGNDFVLLTKEEVFENHIFGYGTEHENFRSMIGDYVALAKGETSIFCMETPQFLFKGFHAGLLEREMKIPLIVYGADEKEKEVSLWR